jgi:serine acetyltransferase
MPGNLFRAARRLNYVRRIWYWRTVLGDQLRTGSAVRLGARLHLKPRKGGTIVLADRVELEYDVNIECSGDLSIGEHTFIGHGTTIGCSGRVQVGKSCLIGEYVSIRDNDHAFDNLTLPIRLQGSRVAPVTIEDNVWIGAKVTVVAGVRIGQDSVIGANAVVTHDIPPGSVAVGVPARVIRTRELSGVEHPG